MNKWIILLLLMCSNLSFAESEDCSYHEIYLNKSSWHTDLIVKADDFPFLAEKYPGFDYVVVGFGDEDFWRAGAFFDKSKWQQFKTVFDSFFLPEDGIMSVYGFNSNYSSPSSSADEVIRLNDKDYERIVNFISDSFKFGDDDAIEFVTQLEGVDLYRSTLNYSLMRTCNSWTAESLSSTSVFAFSAKTSDMVEGAVRKTRISENKRVNGCATHKKSTRRSRRDQQQEMMRSRYE